MKFIIKPLTASSCTEAHGILQQAGRDMFERQGFTHWYPAPVTLQFILDNLHKYQVHGVYQDEKMIATFSLQNAPPDVYNVDLWNDPNGTAIYMKRFAVLPNQQNKGIGAFCLKWIEEKHENMWIRFDVMAKNEKVIKFYRTLGYESRGVVTYKNDVGTWDCLCFEKFSPFTRISKL